MTEVCVGRVDAFDDPGRKVVEVDGVEIGVFLFKGAFTAFESICPHLGGPACQGLMLPRTEDDLKESNVNLARSFSKTHHNVICPWHGMEFDITTGEHVTSPKYRLRKVAVRVQGDEVMVTVPDRRHQHMNASFVGERQRKRSESGAQPGAE